MLITDPLRAPLRTRALEQAVQRPEKIAPTVPLTLLMVYRRANAELVELMVRQAGPEADVRLWALDTVADGLSAQTVGEGPGRRFENLNRLIASRRLAPGTWVVVADDDALFVRGGLGSLTARMSDAHLDVAQPAHSLRSWWNSPFTIARPGIVARQTDYVEQGPVVVFTPTAVAKVFPLPETDDMGWGIEAEWYALSRRGLRLGIVDESRIIHFQRTASSYDAEGEMARMRERLTAADVESIWSLQRTRRRWWWWGAPRWLPASDVRPGGPLT